MPELPEVEVLRRHLEPRLQGRRILEVEVHRPRLVRPSGDAAIREALRGASIQRVDRRGKHLLFVLRTPGGAERTVVGHLGMTGRMYLDSGETDPPRHTAILLRLDRGRFLFEDLRQFGRFHLDLGVLEGIGPEPWSEDWTPDHLLDRLAGTQQPVKTRLLDQSVVAGVGNIYASEALHHAGIDPARPGSRLKPAEARPLWHSIRSVLERAIEDGLRADLDFAGGADGLFYFGSAAGRRSGAERLQVYDREGKACRRCGGTIQRVIQAGRSTFFCPGCQR